MIFSVLWGNFKLPPFFSCTVEMDTNAFNDPYYGCYLTRIYGFQEAPRNHLFHLSGVRLPRLDKDIFIYPSRSQIERDFCIFLTKKALLFESGALLLFV